MLRVLGLAVILIASRAHADPGTANPGIDDRIAESDEPARAWRVRFDNRLRYPIMLFETATILVPPTIYYWNTVGDQREDWELRWDWPSWKKKLFTTDALVLDTNRFLPNGIRHPLTGALSYQVGRANGLGPGGSLALDFAMSLVWEYVIEYREVPSLNDMLTNTVAGHLIGEPLFQIGRLGDGRGANGARRGLSLISSPYHRVQQDLKLSALRPERRPPNELDFLMGTHAVRQEGITRGELALGLDLSVVRERQFGRPGQGTSYGGLGTWNRVMLDLRLGGAEGASGVPGARFRSESVYLGRYDRDLDDNGNGTSTLMAIAGGFELFQRRLHNEWDRLSTFELVGPRLDVYHRNGDIDLAWQVAAYGDFAMVQAHVFGQTPMMGLSVLEWRGYYYALGPTLTTQLRARSGLLEAALEATGHQFWQLDGGSYNQTGPHGVEDQRLVLNGRVGVRPTEDLLLHGFGGTVMRRGTWDTMERHTAELDVGVGITVGF